MPLVGWHHFLIHWYILVFLNYCYTSFIATTSFWPFNIVDYGDLSVILIDLEFVEDKNITHLSVSFYSSQHKQSWGPFYVSNLYQKYKYVLNDWMNFLVKWISETRLTEYTFCKSYACDIWKHQYGKYKTNYSIYSVLFLKMKYTDVFVAFVSNYKNGFLSLKRC